MPELHSQYSNARAIHSFIRTLMGDAPRLRDRLEPSRRCQVLAAAAISGPVYLFNADGSRIAELHGHAFATVAAAWGSPMLATAGQDAKVRLWNPHRWNCEAELGAGAPWVECIGWSRNGACLASGARRTLSIWSDAGDLIRECPPHASTITDIAWHPLRQVLAAACYGGITLWRPDATEAIRRFEYKGSLLAIAWSPDGRMLASGNQHDSVHLWFVDSGKDLHMSGFARKVRELAWSADSRLLASGGTQDVIVWDCSGKGPDGQQPLQLEHHSGPVSSLAFQPSGSVLASGCDSGRVALWRPRSSSKALRATHLEGAISHLAWTPDGSCLAVGTAAGVVATFAPPHADPMGGQQL
ncbi:MAG: WD40 repeat domain-containing protein [Burkholderiales bacterium]